jgi:hypothetical protein
MRRKGEADELVKPAAAQCYFFDFFVLFLSASYTKATAHNLKKSGAALRRRTFGASYAEYTPTPTEADENCTHVLANG